MLSDFYHSFRSLLRAPGFCLVVVVSLALGIGANATALCWLQHLRYDSLPGVKKSGDIAVLVSSQGEGNVSLPDLRDFDALREVFDGVVATQTCAVQVRDGEVSSWRHIQLATANFFEVMGVRPVLGRTFLPEEDRHPGGDNVVVLGEAYWRSHYNASPAVLGQTIQINRHPFTIIGVAEAPFGGTMTGLRFPLWVPVSMCREVMNSGGYSYRGAHMWHNAARLKGGVSLAAAQAALEAMDLRLQAAYPDTNARISHRVLPYTECPWGAQKILLPVMTMLLVMSLLVWLLVLANVSNLMLSRAVRRRQELAIRIATGASRWRVVRLLLSESLVLALFGGVLGLLLSTWGVQLLWLFLPSTDLPTEGLAYAVDLRTVFATLVFTVGTGLAIGLLPALRASRPDLVKDLKEGGRSGSSGAEHGRLRRLLVVSEVALSVVLLICAGLCLKGFYTARTRSLGLDPKGVLIADLGLGMQGYREETALPVYAEIRRRMAALPGVESVGLSSWFPLGFNGCKGLDARPEGYVPAKGEATSFDYARVSPGYFKTLGILLTAGRDFSEADDASARRVAIVNEAFAAFFWPGQDPLGRTFRSGGQLRTVIGVARQGSYYRVSEKARMFFYLPALQGVPELDLGLCLKTQGDPLALVQAMRKSLKTIDPSLDCRGVMRFEDHAMAALFADRVAAGMLALLGLVAAALAALGIYAVMSYNVSQRLREFGIRLALGAAPSSVVRLVLRQCLRLVTWGVAVGLVLAGFASRVLADFLHGVSPFDPLIYGVTPLALAAIALLACLPPSLRATRVSPVEALRAE